MLGKPVLCTGQLAVVVLSLILFSVGAVAAEQNGTRDRPGQFDFYMLALSWSPSYCAEVKERGRARLPQLQCGGRPFSFVVHGLWPQYERGYPTYCQTPSPRIGRSLLEGMLDLMPSARLVYHEWNRHGTCSGLSAPAYFAAVRKARAAVKIPARFVSLAQPIMVTPAEVKDAFLKANPGLQAADLAIACDRTRITEVRICMSRDFLFRACAGVVRRACRHDRLLMPAVR